MILNLFIFIYVFIDKNLDKIKKSISIMALIYILSIFIAILTKTSSSTYIEGMGYKGLYDSGNSLCAILCISLCIILPLIRDKKMMPYAIVFTILARNIFNNISRNKNRSFWIYNNNSTLHSK